MIVYVPIVAVRAFSIGRAVFLYIEKLFSHDLVLRMLEQMRTKLYRILEPQALFLRSTYQTGDLLGVLSDDIEHLQDLYLRTIFPSILGVLIYGIIVFTFGVFDWVFFFMMLFFLGFLVFCIPLLSYRRMKRQHQLFKEQRKSLYQQLTDAIFGLTDWQASGRLQEFFAKYDAQDQQMVQTKRKMQKWHYVRDALIQTVIGVVIILTMIWAGKQADLEVISPTVIAAFTMMMFSVTEALMPISDAVERLPFYTESIHRIQKVENKSKIPVLSTSTVSQETTFSSADLQLTDISYRYPRDQQEVLQNISLNIKAGQKVALLGRSGAGKSTLLKIIAGALKPNQGTITINNKEANHTLLANHVAVLNQKPHLFSTSIANNIRIGKPKASMEEIMEVAKRARLSSLIQSLPEGIHTPMLEMGSRFSGGERQRVAFARVLLQNKPILIVDEATIGLDPKHEKEVLDMILSSTPNKTVIWITHHLAGVRAMDQILFLKDGKIFMQGSHQELFAKEPYYQKLYEMDQGLS